MTEAQEKKQVATDMYYPFPQIESKEMVPENKAQAQEMAYQTINRGILGRAPLSFTEAWAITRQPPEEVQSRGAIDGRYAVVFTNEITAQLFAKQLSTLDIKDTLLLKQFSGDALEVTLDKSEAAPLIRATRKELIYALEETKKSLADATKLENKEHIEWQQRSLTHINDLMTNLLKNFHLEMPRRLIWAELVKSINQFKMGEYVVPFKLEGERPVHLPQLRTVLDSFVGNATKANVSMEVKEKRPARSQPLDLDEPSVEEPRDNGGPSNRR